MLTQAEVEDEIQRLAQILEDLTRDFAGILNDASKAEADYRVAYAKAFLRARLNEKLAEKTAEQKAVAECEEELLFRKAKESIARATEERLRTLRAQLDAVRTLSANVRAQT